MKGSEAAAGLRGHAGWTSAACPSSLVRSAGTVPLTGLLDFRKPAGISCLDTSLHTFLASTQSTRPRAQVSSLMDSQRIAAESTLLRVTAA